MKPLFLLAALIAAAPALALAQAQAYDPIFGGPPPAAAAPRPAVSQSADCPRGAGLVEPPVGARPTGYAWTELWPSNGGCATYGMRDLEFPAAEAAKKAFDAASAVSCVACEGGRSFDSWANHFVPGADVDKKMAALTSATKLTWKGSRLAGEITLIGEQPIGRFPCRQYRWVMRGADAKVVAERTSLQCRNGEAGAWLAMY